MNGIFEFFKQCAVYFIEMGEWGLFALAFMGNVKAYDEPAFQNEQCVTEMGWLDTAKTEYQFNEENGRK